MTSDRILQFMHHLRVDHLDRTLVVLKGHLLLELALREYVGKRVSAPQYIESAQIAFPSLICFAASLEDRLSERWLWPALKKANRLRNQLAHNLEVSQIDELEADFTQYIILNDGEFSIEVDDEEVEYGGLALAFLQLFDAIVHSYPGADKSAGRRTDTASNALVEAFKRVASEDA